MADTCTHLDTVADVAAVERRLRGLPAHRRPLGAPAHVHAMRPRRLLRQLTEPPRHRPLARAPRPPADPLLRTGRGLVVVLRRRPVLRDRRRAAVAVASLNERRLALERAEAQLLTVASDGPAYLLEDYQVLTTGGSSGTRGVLVWDFEGFLM